MQKVISHHPVHVHDCDSCRYLFSFDDGPAFGTVDVYVCGDLTERYDHTLIARFGCDGDYNSLNPIYIRRAGGESTLLKRALLLWSQIHPRMQQISEAADIQKVTLTIERHDEAMIQYRVILTEKMLWHLSVEAPDRIEEGDDGVKWAGDIVANNFATRGLLLELLMPTNPGKSCADSYRAHLMLSLTQLWD